MAAQHLELEGLDDARASFQICDHTIERRRIEFERWRPVSLVTSFRRELRGPGNGFTGRLLGKRLKPEPLMKQTGDGGAEFFQLPEIVFPQADDDLDIGPCHDPVRRAGWAPT